MGSTCYRLVHILLPSCHPFKAGVLNLFSSTSSVVVLLSATEHRHNVSTTTSKDQTFSKSTILYQKSTVVLVSTIMRTLALKYTVM